MYADYIGNHPPHVSRCADETPAVVIVHWPVSRPSCIRGGFPTRRPPRPAVRRGVHGAGGDKGREAAATVLNSPLLDEEDRAFVDANLNAAISQAQLEIEAGGRIRRHTSH